MASPDSILSFFSSQPAPKASTDVTQFIQSSFDPKNKDHLTFLTKRTTTLKEKLAELQTTDAHIIAGLMAGATAFTLSSILPFGVMMAIAGFSYGAYYIGKREELAKEYRSALSDAVACLKWTLEKVENNQDKIAEEAMALFDELSPLMNETQIRTAIPDNVKNDFIEKAAQKKQDLFGRPLNPQEKALVYGIYGYEQGGALDVAKGLWYLVCQAVNCVFQSVKSLFNSQASTDTSATPTANNVK